MRVVFCACVCVYVCVCLSLSVLCECACALCAVFVVFLMFCALSSHLSLDDASLHSSRWCMWARHPVLVGHTAGRPTNTLEVFVCVYMVRLLCVSFFVVCLSCMRDFDTLCSATCLLFCLAAQRSAELLRCHYPADFTRGRERKMNHTRLPASPCVVLFDRAVGQLSSAISPIQQPASLTHVLFVRFFSFFLRPFRALALSSTAVSGHPIDIQLRSLVRDEGPPHGNCGYLGAVRGRGIQVRKLSGIFLEFFSLSPSLPRKTCSTCILCLFYSFFTPKTGHQTFVVLFIVDIQTRKF